MTTEADLDIWLERRRFHHIRRVPKYRITLHTGARTKYSTEGETVEIVWAALVTYADLFGGVEITSPCPWDEKGRRR